MIPNNPKLFWLYIYNILINLCISIIDETLGTTTTKIQIQRGTNIREQVFLRKYIEISCKKNNITTVKQNLQKPGHGSIWNKRNRHITSRICYFFENGVFNNISSNFKNPYCQYSKTLGAEMLRCFRLKWLD